MNACRTILLGTARSTDRIRGRRLAAGALVLALVASGCGSDDAASDASDDLEAADAPVDTPADSSEDDLDESADEPADGELADDGDASTGDLNADDPDADDANGAGTAARADSYDAAPELTIEPDADYRATIETGLGTIEVELYADDAPVTVNSFVFLAREGYYDGLIFHRVIPGFVAQAGDPLGSGMGGPGYAFEDELAAAERDGYDLGTLAMANSGPNTNGSQFFLTVDDADLPPLYSVFGQVTSGLEVLEAIAGQPTGPGDRPVDDIRIATIAVDGP